jgi:1-acyl-sn-glycerol-3-phosphate acyltransferase
MNTSHAPRARHRDWWRPVRYLYRIPLLFVHFVLGLLMCVLIVGPRREAVARDGREPLAHRLTRWWSKGLMRIFGFRTRQVGQPLPDAAMFVCNHVTWLDIELVHSQRAACFVAKAEIARWPVVGWLAACGGTIFHKRGSNHSLSAVMQVMVERMREGRSVAVFPEGGTSHNGELRVFHARIFQAALDAEVPVQPVALRYLRNGKPAPDMLFTRGESFLHNVGRVLATRSLTAEVHFLQPVVFEAQGGRRRMAETARAEIAQVLGIPA